MTALHKLIERGKRLDYIEILLKNGSNVNGQNNNDKAQTPLHFAILYGTDNKEKNMNKTDMAKLLLKYNANPNLRDNLGQTPLHVAFAEGKYEMVNLLLEHNADPHIKDKQNRTCLYYAMDFFHTESEDIDSIIKLLDLGVDLYGEFASGDCNGYDSKNSPLWNFLDKYANKVAAIAIVAKKKLLDYLLKNEMNRFNIVFYVQDKEIISGYTYSGNPITKNISFQTTPLHWALENKHLDIAKRIIERSDDVHLCIGLNNMFPLELACVNDYPEIIEIIVAKLNNNNNIKKKIENNNQYEVLS